MLLSKTIRVIMFGLGLVMALSLGCRRAHSIRPRVTNPLIDSAEKFEPVYTESVVPGKTGFEVFTKMLAGESTAGRETATAACARETPGSRRIELDGRH